MGRDKATLTLDGVSLAARAARIGLIDATRPGTPEAFEAEVLAHARSRATGDGLARRLAEKDRRMTADAARKPLADYRAEELARMRLNFFGFDTSYHMARHDFITQVPKSRTPLYLATHRRRAAARTPA